MGIECHNCKKVINNDDIYTHHNMELCEDCYMNVMDTSKTCDPWAVSAATRDRKNRSLNDNDDLTDIQKSIFSFVKEKGKVLPEEITAALKISRIELERQFTILRHCELLKGYKEGNKLFITHPSQGAVAL